MSVIEIQNIKLSYGSRILLENFSLTALPGEFIGILGANGAGKSTLLRALAGIQKPVQGQILIQGQDACRIDKLLRSKTLSWYGQESLLGLELTVEEYVLLGRLPHRQWRDWLGMSQSHHLLVQECLHWLGCQELSQRLVHSLSSGEWQLVQFARIVVQQSQWILADEPAAHLDLIQKRLFYQRLAEICQQGRGAFLISHDLDLCLRYCHRLIVLDGRGSWAVGNPEDEELQNFIQEIFGNISG